MPLYDLETLELLRRIRAEVQPRRLENLIEELCQRLDHAAVCAETGVSWPFHGETVERVR